MSTFDWLVIKKKCGFQLAKRFTWCEFFKLFITKDNYVRADEFAVIPIPSKSLV